MLSLHAINYVKHRDPTDPPAPKGRWKMPVSLPSWFTAASKKVGPTSRALENKVSERAFGVEAPI